MFDNVEKTLGDDQILFYLFISGERGCAKKMPKDGKVVKKMWDDTKNTLNNIRKMLGNVGNANKTLKDAEKSSFQTRKVHFNNFQKVLLVYGCYEGC
jgi:hypothetical protein